MSDEINNIIEKRNQLEQRRSRLLGKLEAAKSALSNIDSELEELGINPSNLEEEIISLEKEKNDKIQSLSLALSEAEKLIKQIEERMMEI